MSKASTCAALALALSAAGPAVAQTIWTPIEHQPSFRMEALHPRFKLADGVDVSVLSGALFLTGALPIHDRWMFIAELPFARSKVTVSGESSSKSAIGNPYLGVQFGRATAPTGIVAEFGVRPALIGDDDFEAAFVGITADIDRFEAFSNKLTTVSAAGNLYTRAAQTTGRLRVGVSEQFYDKGESETMLDYGALGSFDVNRLRLGAALTGRYLLTESGSFSDRSMHHGAASASVAFGQVRPGLLIRVPFDKEFRDNVPSIVGLTLDYTFR